MDTVARCDLHVHSIYSTDTGNFALRRAGLGESYTDPQRVYDVCRRRGMNYVTISDHNTIEGALRIAHLPGTFLSVEVTTRFPEDETPLHVLVWGLSEEDHHDLQPYRSSVYELVAFLQERGLAHAIAHPLYRMGTSLTVSHVERMMLLFGAWEVRNGARPEHSNELARALALAATPSYLAKLAERHGFESRHDGIALTAWLRRSRRARHRRHLDRSAGVHSDGLSRSCLQADWASRPERTARRSSLRMRWARSSFMPTAVAVARCPRLATR